MNISIVIPVYNSEETIKECVDSVIEAEIPAETIIEIIAVNDGSTDRTKSVLESYPQIKKINLNENSGRIIARKTGAENASYDNLLFVDSRVKVNKDILKKEMTLGTVVAAVESSSEDTQAEVKENVTILAGNNATTVKEVVTKVKENGITVIEP